MKNRAIATYNRLLNASHHQTHRYLFTQFSLESRLTGLVGSRGTGKTTLMLQYIKEQIPDRQECIYVSLDSIFFQKPF